MTRTIQNYMTKIPFCIREDSSLSLAMEMMRKHKVHHLPVENSGKLVGVLSDRDVKLALTVHPAAKDLKAGDIMTEKPYAVTADTSLDEVLHEMSLHKYGSALVKGEHNELIGIFTTSDAVRTLKELLHHEQRGCRVERACCAS